MYLALLVVLGLHVSSIDHVTARTTWQLWKRLFKLQKQACDFAGIVPREANYHYMACTQDNEILSIVVCRRKTLSQVEMHHVGYAPGKKCAARELLAELDSQNFTVDWQDMAAQPVWFLELLTMS